MSSHELRVDPEFRDLLPKLSATELASLEASIERDGCRDHIITWANNDDTIVDGHNRYEICRRLGVQFKTKAVTFVDRDAVKEFIYSNQDARRNWTPEQRKFCIGKLYEIRKKIHGSEKGGRGNQYVVSVHGAHLPKTAEEVASESGLNEGTVRRAEHYAKGLDKIEKVMGSEVKAGILSGDIKVPHYEVQKLGQEDGVQPEFITEVVNREKKAAPARKQPPQSDPIEGKHRGVGVLRANEAINCLMQIPKNDQLRKRGFQIVTDWIKANS